jgi:hypothetical protein
MNRICTAPAGETLSAGRDSSVGESPGKGIRSVDCARLCSAFLVFFLALASSPAAAKKAPSLQNSLQDIAPELLESHEIEASDQLLVVIRYPTMFDSDQSVQNVQAMMLRKSLQVGAIDPSDWETKLQIDWAQQIALRSTYLALELYYQLREKLPENSIALQPTVLSFDGFNLTQTEASDAPASFFFVDLSAVVLPQNLDVAYDSFCGTCGFFVVPFITISVELPNFDWPFSRSCMWDYSGVNPKSGSWDYRSTKNLSGSNSGSTWLDMVNLTATEGKLGAMLLHDRMCLLAEFRTETGQAGEYRQHEKPKKKGTLNRAGSLGTILLPTALALHMENFVRDEEPSAFDVRVSGFHGWGGYLNLIEKVILYGLASAPRNGETWNRVDTHHTHRIGDLYQIPEEKLESAEVTGLLDSIMRIESKFSADVSRRYFSTMYEGAFGEYYRRRLAAEVEARNQSSWRPWTTMEAAGQADLVAGQADSPLADPALWSVAESLAGETTGSTNAMAVQLSAFGDAPFTFSAELGSEAIVISSTSIDDLRTKMRVVAHEVLGIE